MLSKIILLFKEVHKFKRNRLQFHKFYNIMSLKKIESKIQVSIYVNIILLRLINSMEILN